MVTEITVADIEEVAISNNTTNINIGARGLPFLSLNHVSFVCKSVNKSVEFYEQVLGFVLIKRPSSFDFEGACVKEKKGKINPKDNHISFQCSDMDLIVHQLENMKVEYITAVVKEGGIIVDQIFFHDPDGYMIEICNCQNLPVLPISSCSLTNNMSNHKINLTSASAYGRMKCSGEVEALMIENLALDMINISI
ncbi:metallothiol transferase fosB [Striga asiatica]|uniref:Metallothiol transferase fosB n=1 Tax=Striga asiatica TaxID=4170 RepID=A0A5A7QL06_STRAF|nr:metallothiol transferase fosB [Striga asiatica]